LEEKRPGLPGKNQLTGKKKKKKKEKKKKGKIVRDVARDKLEYYFFSHFDRSNHLYPSHPIPGHSCTSFISNPATKTILPLTINFFYFVSGFPVVGWIFFLS
jgi:hypothetical protein